MFALRALRDLLFRALEACLAVPAGDFRAAEPTKRKACIGLAGLRSREMRFAAVVRRAMGGSFRCGS